MHTPEHLRIERVQTGVRIEKRMLKVLKALAEYHDITLGELLEAIILHAFEGKSPFPDEGLKKIAVLKEVYNMDYGASASHHLIEDDEMSTCGGADVKRDD
jgi:hypothetical protein